MRGADILVEMLIGYGVDTIFGVPGDTNVPLYEALQHREDEIRHVMARDERSAGYMADAYGRFTNRPGVFECPSGAGAMYSLPPVAESNGSSVPVILLTIDIPLPGEGRGVLTELDCAKLFEPVTKLSVQVKSPEKLPEIFRRAFRVACSGKPGAVHLQIPEDMLLAEVDPARISLHVEKECRTFPAYPTLPPRAKLEDLLKLLAKAERPLIVAGGGVNRARAGDRITELAEKYNVPMCTTMTGQGAIDDDHRLAIGVIGDNGFHPHANWALEHSDFTLFIGSRIGSVVTIGWTFPRITLNRRLAQIDISPEIMANNYENLLSIQGDALLVLEALLSLDAAIEPARHDAWIDELNSRRKVFWDHAEEALCDERVPLRPERAVRAFVPELAQRRHDAPLDETVEELPRGAVEPDHDRLADGRRVAAHAVPPVYRVRCSPAAEGVAMQEERVWLHPPRPRIVRTARGASSGMTKASRSPRCSTSATTGAPSGSACGR